jgi:hypothetical protein
VAFFSFHAELKNPHDFKKALFLEQGIAVTFYMLISVVIYYFAGPLVASPALGSASPLVTKIAFGIALPTIIVAGVVNGSVASKYIYFRIWSGTNVVHEKSVKSLGSWYGICAVAWIVSWILAESIPNFNLFLSLIGALFGSLFSCEWLLWLQIECGLTHDTDALPPVLSLYQHRGKWFSTKRKGAWMILNFAVVALGSAIVSLHSQLISSGDCQLT